MTNIKEFINSGIIEVYCLGAATDEEQLQVEQMAQQYPEVRDEITAVREALVDFALGSRPVPLAEIKNKIMEAIANDEKKVAVFPPQLSIHSALKEWTSYMLDNTIQAPASYDLFHIEDLPGDAKQVTYIVWAKKGVVIEESHAEEDEYLLMMEGYCSVTIDGVLGYYKAGDVVYIPKGTVHRAEVLSDEPMLVIGQRQAA